jgi:hypothetical protein
MAQINVLSCLSHVSFHDQNESDYHQNRTAIAPQPSGNKVNVRLPDMFVLFLAEPPRVNSYYDQIKAESEAWFAEYYPFLYILFDPTRFFENNMKIMIRNI